MVLQFVCIVRPIFSNVLATADGSAMGLYDVLFVGLS